MPFSMDFPSVAIPYAFLFISLISFWIRPFRVLIAPMFAVLSLILFWYLGSIESSAMLFMIAFVLLNYILFKKVTNRMPLFVLLFLIWIGATTAFLMHLVPGIHNYLAIPAIQLSFDSYPYQLFLNIDTAFVGLVTVFFGTTLLSREPFLEMLKRTIKSLKSSYLALSFLIMYVMAIFLNFIHWDPKIASFLPIWILSNLFITAFTEELVFRGIIQNQLGEFFKKHRLGTTAALLISSLLFGLKHWPQGGPMLVLLSFLAGTLYGSFYLKTKRLESAILMHFLLNLAHIVFFSYPALFIR